MTKPKPSRRGEATVLAEIYPSYFNRSYKHYSSHQHAPDDPAAASLGAAVTEHNGAAYIAYPIFRLYRAMGQPLYKYVVRGLLDRLIPDPAMVTDLPSLRAGDADPADWPAPPLSCTCFMARLRSAARTYVAMMARHE